LNHSALIQMYTTTSVKGGNIELKAFRSVYPNGITKGVELSSHKTYYSTGNKGNLTFKIL